jgi:hypothetical protein
MHLLICPLRHCVGALMSWKRSLLGIGSTGSSNQAAAPADFALKTTVVINSVRNP